MMPGIQRVGSTSMVKAFPNMIGAEEALSYPRRLAFIRHPLRRLTSTFVHLIDVEYCIKRTWKQFVDYILTHEDRHWSPQERRLYFENRWIPTHLERFENINRVWDKYSAKAFPHYNRGLGEPYCDPEYEKDALEAYYEKDLELWYGLA